MIKTLNRTLKQDRERFTLPKNVQDIIPVQSVYPDGIFQTGKNKFSKTFRFEDINYYVASSEDFMPPKEEEEAVVPEEEDREAPVWNTTVDELVSFLEEKGLIHADSKVTLSAEGLCTLALKYDGAEIYWWDLENLAPESDEYQAYESLRTKGEIDLYGSGMIIMPKKNGPYALLLTYYEGDVQALEKAFGEFGQEN